jgi:peptidoglycan/LPS O-acetylase OafA/YrhL
MVKSDASPLKPIEPLRALTGLRGLAAWWVVAYHFREALGGAIPGFVARFLDRGYLAVDLFFVLSGYVIALNYAIWFQPETRAKNAYKEFLALRLSRIYPVHFFVLVLFLVNPVAALLSTHHRPLENLHPGYYALSYLLMQGWGLVDGPAWNVPAWSISVEWIAYILFPFISRASMAIAVSTLGAVTLIVALAIALEAALCLLHFSSLQDDFQLAGVARCLCEFSMGVGVCKLAEYTANRDRYRVAARMMAAAAVLAVIWWPEHEYAFLPLGFTALVYGLSTELGMLATALRLVPVQWLGQISYSTYISHYLIKSWIKYVFLRPGIRPEWAFFAYASAVLVASAILHYAVERPAQAASRQMIRNHFHG